MRFMILGIAGALVACHPMHRVTVEAAFNVDAKGGGTQVTCIEATGGACQLDFHANPLVHAAVPQGQTHHFDIGPGVPICLEADARGLSECKPTSLDVGPSRIRKSSEHD